MRPKPERDPRRAARERILAAENAALAAHLEECAAIAAMLARDSERALARARQRGRRASAAERGDQGKRVMLAQFFAGEALAHARCGMPACKRARRCASRSLGCQAGRVLSREEESVAKGLFFGWLRFMTTPAGEAPAPCASRGGSKPDANPFAAIQNAAESPDTGAGRPAPQGSGCPR